MNDTMVWAVLIVLGLMSLAAAVGVAFAAWRGATSSLRPLPIPFIAWRQAYRLAFSRWKFVLGMAAIVSLGIGLQEYFASTRGYNPSVLVVASIFWQAVMASAMAALAAPLHLAIIAAEPHESFVVEGFDIQKRGLSRLMLLAAAFGLAIWLFDTGFRTGLNELKLLAPARFHTIIAFGSAFVSFLITTLLTLVRPALSSGLPRPLRVGVQKAAQHAPALYVMSGLLLIPPLLFSLSIALVFNLLFAPSTFMHGLYDICVILFNLFQFIAIEAATVIFLRTALLKPVAHFQFGRMEGERAYADFRPY